MEEERSASTPKSNNTWVQRAWDGKFSQYAYYEKFRTLTMWDM